MASFIGTGERDSHVGKLLRFLGLAWGLLALAVWLKDGWKYQSRPSWYPELTRSEFPSEQLIALAAWGLLTLASAGWGNLAGRLFGVLPARRGAARLAVLILLGHTVTALLAFLVGLVHLLPWGLGLLIAGFAGLRDEWRFWRKAGVPGHLWPQTSSPRVWLIIALLPLVLSFLMAFAPAEESDGMRYHLFGPQEYLKAGHIGNIPYNAFTNLPFQTNMLFMTGMAFSNERTPQVVHWTYLPLIMVFAGMLARSLLRLWLARRRQPNQPAWVEHWSAAAAVLAGSIPALLVISSWPFIDLSTLAFLLAAVWALSPASIRRFDKRLLLSGIFAGAAIGTKLTALPAAFLVGLVVLGMLVCRRRKAFRLALFVLPIVAVSGPWFVKSTLIHGNPVYPAAYSVFGGPEWTQEADELYKTKAGAKGKHPSAVNLLLSPLDVSLGWPNYEAHNPGPVILALMPIALVGLLVAIWRRKHSPLPWLILFQLLFGWILWFLTYQSVRFLLPQIVFIAVSGTAFLAVLTRGRFLAGITAAGLVLGLAVSGIWWHAFYNLEANPKRPLSGALGAISEDDYLSTNLNYYTAVQWLNFETEPAEAVFYIGEHRGTYARFPLFSSDWFDVPRVLVDIRQTESNREMLRLWREKGIRYVLWNHEELRKYETFDFRWRFTDKEWERYLNLKNYLLRSGNFAFRGDERVYVIDLRLLE